MLFGGQLPTTSVDQYAADLAKWLGVADSEMAGILLKLSHFGLAAGRADRPTNLGRVTSKTLLFQEQYPHILIRIEAYLMH